MPRWSLLVHLERFSVIKFLVRTRIPDLIPEFSRAVPGRTVPSQAPLIFSKYQNTHLKLTSLSFPSCTGNSRPFSALTNVTAATHKAQINVLQFIQI